MPKKKTKPSPEDLKYIGIHNQQYAANPTEIIKGNSYKDRSTVIFIPTLGSVPIQAIQSYNNLMRPMNQKVTQIYLDNHEVGKAYEQMVDILRTHPDLRKWKYCLTLEHDNLPPPDGLLKLYDDMEAGNWDALGGLYWLKGENGKPMAYGRPRDDNGIPIVPMDFIPWLPPLGTVAEVNGLGMGFTLFRIKMLLDEKLPRPIFLTEQSYTPGVGIRAFTQDLRAFQMFKNAGYKFAVSTKVLVGHLDPSTGMVW